MVDDVVSQLPDRVIAPAPWSSSPNSSAIVICTHARWWPFHTGSSIAFANSPSSLPTRSYVELSEKSPLT
jgi:hypothetical protein